MTKPDERTSEAAVDLLPELHHRLALLVELGATARLQRLLADLEDVCGVRLPALALPSPAPDQLRALAARLASPAAHVVAARHLPMPRELLAAPVTRAPGTSSPRAGGPRDLDTVDALRAFVAELTDAVDAGEHRPLLAHIPAWLRAFHRLDTLELLHDGLALAELLFGLGAIRSVGLRSSDAATDLRRWLERREELDMAPLIRAETLAVRGVLAAMSPVHPRAAARLPAWDTLQLWSAALHSARAAPAFAPRWFAQRVAGLAPLLEAEPSPTRSGTTKVPPIVEVGPSPERHCARKVQAQRSHGWSHEAHRFVGKEQGGKRTSVRDRRGDADPRRDASMDPEPVGSGRDLLGQVAALCAERCGPGVAAALWTERGAAYAAVRDDVGALRAYMTARACWSLAGWQRGVHLSSLMAARRAGRAGLLWAACSLLQTVLDDEAATPLDEAPDLHVDALLRLAEATASLGALATSVACYEAAQRRALVTRNAARLHKGRMLVVLEAGERTAPGFRAWALARWGGVEALRGRGPDALAWDRKSVEVAEAFASRRFGTCTWGDVGPMVGEAQCDRRSARDASWRALGAVWTVRWSSDAVSEAVATAAAGALQIAQAGLERCAYPTAAAIDVELVAGTLPMEVSLEREVLTVRAGVPSAARPGASGWARALAQAIVGWAGRDRTPAVGQPQRALFKLADSPGGGLRPRSTLEALANVAQTAPAPLPRPPGPVPVASTALAPAERCYQRAADPERHRSQEEGA